MKGRVIGTDREEEGEISQLKRGEKIELTIQRKLRKLWEKLGFHSFFHLSTIFQ